MHVTQRSQPLFVALVAAMVVAMVTSFSPARAAEVPGTVSGVDVSGHQRPGGHAIDWRGVAGAGGQQFAFIKASEGEGWTNEFFNDDVSAAAQAGLKVGAYHYARPAKDPVAQAKHFSNLINSRPELNLHPVLDLEVDEKLPPAALIAWTQSFLTEVERETGKKPMIYTYRYFWSERMAGTTAFTTYPLWLAAYQNQPPRPVGGWDKLTFWQNSDAGRISGISTPIDTNIFNGDAADLNNFAAGDYSAAGGTLEEYQTSEGAVLGQGSEDLTVSILQLATGIINSDAMADKFAQSGFDQQDAQKIAGLVAQLISKGELPVSDLRSMMIGDYSIGDLIILLDNAAKLAD